MPQSAFCSLPCPIRQPNLFEPLLTFPDAGTVFQTREGEITDSPWETPAEEVPS